MAIKIVSPELCNGCGICVKSCPMDVIRIDKKIKKAIITYPEECMLCELCIIDCPNKVLQLSPDKDTIPPISWK